MTNNTPLSSIVEGAERVGLAAEQRRDRDSVEQTALHQAARKAAEEIANMFEVFTENPNVIAEVIYRHVRAMREL